MLLRIGDKLINRQKIVRLLDAILEMRVRGLSQQEVATRIGIDRSVVSRLETLGEVRKGKRIALVGFPLENCAELRQMARQEGIEYCLVMTETERWNFVLHKTGVELFEEIMRIITNLRQFDIVIILASNKRIQLVEALLDKEVIGYEIGESPIAEDKYVSLDSVRSILAHLRDD
ncbi:helix-turn-helix domain-containing protein [Acetonema longum]|uniref:Putative transcriptional regulator n=1 Tax=Acetonema longum DSM 6540 TaxID=1009370 RepID=F7NMS0_9FIRM|nr:helix-turn-helix domain-containing protein [Acetonema longum]EGO62662.1 putative transcriptional regulator [Acetonema longum DSM 6540]